MKTNPENQICKKSVYIIFGSIIFILTASFLMYMEEHHCESGVRFINKDFVCHKKPVVHKKEYAQTRRMIEDFIKEQKELGKVEHVSVYFRDLENGPMFDIGGHQDFAPASLLKLPLALVFMSLAESDPDILFQKIQFKSSDKNFVQEFGAHVLESGKIYSIEVLISNMIAYSNNDAYQMLYDYAISKYGDSIIYETYLELGILSPKDAYDEIISVRTYSSILRALYNASLISHEFSEKLLSWLADSQFKVGLAKGVPEEISIAHKFGERGMLDNTKQLHDCGIIYYPKNPYLLCVMTHGKDFDDLTDIIFHVSDVIYKEFDSRRL